MLFYLILKLTKAVYKTRMKAMDKVICTNPFRYCDIDMEGNVYLCCNKWCSFYSVGNILEDDLQEIFYGQKIKEFINQFINQDFKYCRIDMCLGAQKVDDDNFNKLFDKLSCNSKRQIRLNFDTSCNLQCIFCRHNFEMADEKQKEITEKMLSKIKSFLPVLDENHWEISLNGVGEVFVSKPFLEFMRFTAQNYKNIKFQIITNGILCSKSMLDNLEITERISGIEVSVHAFSEKTYNKLVKGGNFKKLCENLKYISRLKKSGIIDRFQMNFAINSYNYKEMEKFAKWAIKLGAIPSFLPLLILNENERTQFDKMNVASSSHQEYNCFLKIIRRLKKLQGEISIPEHYFSLLPLKEKSLFEKILKR